MFVAVSYFKKSDTFEIVLSKMSGGTGWRIDDLDGGLSADLYNLSGLGNELNTENGAYNMR